MSKPPAVAIDRCSTTMRAGMMSRAKHVKSILLIVEAHALCTTKSHWMVMVLDPHNQCLNQSAVWQRILSVGGDLHSFNRACDAIKVPLDLRFMIPASFRVSNTLIP